MRMSVLPGSSPVKKRMQTRMLPLVGGLAALISTQAAGQSQDRGLTAARAVSDQYHDESAAIADGSPQRTTALSFPVSAAWVLTT